MANFYTDNENLKLQLDHPLMERIVKMKEEDYSFAKTEPIAPLNFEDAMDTLNFGIYDTGEVIGPTEQDQKGARVEMEKLVYAGE